MPFEISLRDYQQQLYDAAQNAFRCGFKRPLIVAPCGSGKSYLFLKICVSAAKKGKVLILVHRKELKAQHLKLFADARVDMQNLRVALFFSEARQLGKHPAPSLIIADEAHWIPDSLKKVLNFYGAPCIGLTATPVRLGGEGLGAVYDTLIEGPSVSFLIANKRLAPFTYYAPTLVDVSGLKASKTGDYAKADIEPAFAKNAVYGDAVAHYKKLAYGKKAIAYCIGIDHSKKTAEAFNNAGVAAAHIDADTPQKKRTEIMQKFRSGEILVLCNCMLIVEGISVDDCECCLLLRPTQSLALYIQSAMRCMRYKEGKTAVILDFVGNYTRFGLPDAQHLWTLNGSKRPRAPKDEFNEDGTFKIRQCPQCFKVFATADVCPFCGSKYPLHKREIEQIKNIQLSLITQQQIAEKEKLQKAQRREVALAKSYADLLKIETARGYKKGWAFLAAKRRGYKI